MEEGSQWHKLPAWDCGQRCCRVHLKAVHSPDPESHGEAAAACPQRSTTWGSGRSCRSGSRRIQENPTATPQWQSSAWVSPAPGARCEWWVFCTTSVVTPPHQKPEATFSVISGPRSRVVLALEMTVTAGPYFQARGRHQHCCKSPPRNGPKGRLQRPQPGLRTLGCLIRLDSQPQAQSGGTVTGSGNPRVIPLLVSLKRNTEAPGGREGATCQPSGYQGGTNRPCDAQGSRPPAYVLPTAGLSKLLHSKHQTLGAAPPSAEGVWVTGGPFSRPQPHHAGCAPAAGLCVHPANGFHCRAGTHSKRHRNSLDQVEKQPGLGVACSDNNILYKAVLWKRSSVGTHSRTGREGQLPTLRRGPNPAGGGLLRPTWCIRDRGKEARLEGAAALTPESTVPRSGDARPPSALTTSRASLKGWLMGAEERRPRDTGCWGWTCGVRGVAKREPDGAWPRADLRTVCASQKKDGCESSRIKDRRGVATRSSTGLRMKLAPRPTPQTEGTHTLPGMRTQVISQKQVKQSSLSPRGASLTLQKSAALKLQAVSKQLTRPGCSSPPRLFLRGPDSTGGAGDEISTLLTETADGFLTLLPREDTATARGLPPEEGLPQNCEKRALLCKPLHLPPNAYALGTACDYPLQFQRVRPCPGRSTRAWVGWKPETRPRVAALLLLPLQLVFLPGPLPTVLGGGAGSDSNWSQLQASLGRSSGSPAFTLTWVWNCRESGQWQLIHARRSKRGNARLLPTPPPSTLPLRWGGHAERSFSRALALRFCLGQEQGTRQLNRAQRKKCKTKGAVRSREVVVKGRQSREDSRELVKRNQQGPLEFRAVIKQGPQKCFPPRSQSDCIHFQWSLTAGCCQGKRKGGRQTHPIPGEAGAPRAAPPQEAKPDIQHWGGGTLCPAAAGPPQVRMERSPGRPRTRP
ncbi:hypothetical protein Cadr_000026709 [Camelus dromedarius]|uniref:Uncharacterized protein n=1 Tax=Camelus dromedarius TaxID=9838 RepID=A0A5N4CFB5_CAMDR|nr:hypothetical protein Cadr_000026709 [Camelus dromedarius]